EPLLARHDEIGDDQLRHRLAEHPHAVEAVLSGRHVVSVRLQNPGDRPPHQHVVVDQQNLHRKLPSLPSEPTFCGIASARGAHNRRKAESNQRDQIGIASRVSICRLSSTASLRANFQAPPSRTMRSTYCPTANSVMPPSCIVRTTMKLAVAST